MVARLPRRKRNNPKVKFTDAYTRIKFVFKSHHDVDSTSNLEKIIETFLSVFDLIKLILIDKNDVHIEHDHLLINEELNLDERI